MMRSLYSGVSGLKVHQTRMDVIGNNIANVNTTAYKAKTLNFSDMLYQTTQAATGPNTANGTAGTNPRQIGLGVKTGAINTSITTEGATQSTGNPFDLKLTGEAFFIVSDGVNQYYTRDGSFNVDAAGYLAMANTGYTVLGWPADTEGNLQTGAVKPIQVLSEANSTYAAAATTAAVVGGIIDDADVDFENLTENSKGQLFNVSLYDKRGYEYSLQFGMKPVTTEKTSTKTITNKDIYYDIADKIYLVDNSERKFTITYTSGGSATLDSTKMPSGLEKKIDEQIQEMFKQGRLTLGEVATIQFKIEETNVSGKYTVKSSNPEGFDFETEFGDYSTLNGATITVTLDGTTAYSTTNDKSGIVEISESTVEKLYGEKLNKESASTFVSSKMDIVVTEKTLESGESVDPAIYTATLNSGALNLTSLDVKLSDIQNLLKKAGGKVQSQYITSENTTLTEKIAGQFAVTLLGLTDVNGNSIDLGALEGTTSNLLFNASDGKFSGVDTAENNFMNINLSTVGENGNFEDIQIDMSSLVNSDNNGKNSIESSKGNIDGDSTTVGRKLGTLSGVSIGTDGVVTANYSNGMSKTVAQICVATFANAMGLENQGDNLYSSTSNTGDLQIVDIKASGTGYMTTGVLEMSNVDLSQQFTDMITTQRGFQANSRIITTSDTLLEELVNLKR